jgi:acyl carrier protein
MASYLESLALTCDLLRRHVDDARTIGPSDDIQKDLGLDSLAVMELVSEVENLFGVCVPSDMFEHISTVDDVVRVVQRLKLR